MSRTILIIEDDRDIAQLVALHLRDLGCAVEVVHNGHIGLRQALTMSYDLIILDLMLPGVDGLDICQQLRTRPNYTPILILTAKSTAWDRVVGLEMGADDYLTKPFSIQELLARVKALFRRMEALQSQAASGGEETIRAGDLTIEVPKRQVTLRGQAVSLTARSSTCCSSLRNIRAGCIPVRNCWIWCGDMAMKATNTRSIRILIACAPKLSAIRGARAMC